MLELILSPALWFIGLVAWAFTFTTSHTNVARVIDKKVPLAQAQPGQLYTGGSEATSKLEMRIRSDLKAAGFKLYPQGTALITYPDENGNKHRYTPDIIVKKPKVIVEVDPEFTHLGKEHDDERRGRLYQQLGYGVVRYRLGKNLRRMGPYDVVRPYKDYNKKMDLKLLTSRIKRAKPDKNLYKGGK